MEGILYQPIGLSEVVNLDSFEGDEYDRRTVQVMGVDGLEIECDVYVWVGGENRLKDEWNMSAPGVKKIA